VIDLADELFRMTTVVERLKIVRGSVGCHGQVGKGQTAGDGDTDVVEVGRSNLICRKRLSAFLSSEIRSGTTDEWQKGFR
jgi:hypothetical protein